MRFLRVGTELKEGNYVRNLGRSVLSDSSKTLLTTSMAARLNAPFGARCFLTHRRGDPGTGHGLRLNAPFGARCFLTGSYEAVRVRLDPVLMHRLALGAF